MTDSRDDLAPSVPAPPPPPAPVPAGGRRARSPGLLVAGCAVLFVASVALAVLAASLSSSRSTERANRSSIARTTGAVAEALLTYDFKNLDGTHARVLDLATGKFKQEYAAAFPSLKQLLVQTQARSRATVKDVFIGPITDGTASAIAVVDAQATGSSGTNRIADSYMRVTLVKVDGRWLVDDVTNLNFGAPSQSTPGRSTTTTAPK